MFLNTSMEKDILKDGMVDTAVNELGGVVGKAVPVPEGEIIVDQEEAQKEADRQIEELEKMLKEQKEKTE
jgi:hypothetical protein